MKEKCVIILNDMLEERCNKKNTELWNLRLDQKLIDWKAYMREQGYL